MKYSYNWIQKHIAVPLPAPQDLAETIIAHAFEVESLEEKNGDTILDIKVLPDRAGDCFSHRGMAREIAGLLSLPLIAQAPVIDIATLKESFGTQGNPVYLQQDLCNRYVAITLEGVTVTASPEWLATALDSLGQKSINAVVDLTNYILLDTGQPIHAFDADLVVGGLVVRYAHEGETIMTLSGEEKVLTSTMLVIADQEKVLAIAGVKGGMAARITEKTTRIIVEIAHFDAVSVRKTSRSLGLITDASKRFENNISARGIDGVVAQTVDHCMQLAGGVVTGVTDIAQKEQPVHTISFTVFDLQRLLGEWVSAAKVSNVFDRYGYSYTQEGDSFVLVVPFWRQDVTGVHDLAEEIGRVIGYDGITTKALPTLFTRNDSQEYQAAQAVKTYLVSQGYSEVYTYSFCKKGEVYIAHGAAGKSALRSAIGPALLESYKQNNVLSAVLAVNPQKIFEIGSVFTEQGEQVVVATVTMGILEEMSVASYVVANNLDVVTLYKDSALHALPAENTAFTPWSNYPYIVRDIAVWVSEETKKQFITIVESFAGEYCAVPARCFDTFTKEGRTSMAYRFVFQSYDRTLTDSEVDATFAQLATLLSEKGFVIR